MKDGSLGEKKKISPSLEVGRVIGNRGRICALFDRGGTLVIASRIMPLI